MSLVDSLYSIDDYIWYIAFAVIAAIGALATVLLRGVQFRGLGEMVRTTFDLNKIPHPGKISSFHVFCMSMGSRIGVGNIAGPVTAIIAGGAGAIFWMWVFAAIGMATSFLETTIGQIYKTPKEDGGFRGGPAYTMFHGLGMKKLGLVLAFIMILMYLVGYVSGEAVSMAEALNGVFDEHDIDGQWFTAIFITSLAAVIVFLGVYRVADMSVWIVPAMALGWFIMCIVSIALSGDGILDAFGSIFGDALSPPSVIGGGLGTAIMWGLRRGVWSNEAGIGTITNLSSIADVKHPAQQGYTQAFGVLVDTLVSTVTALVFLSYADVGAFIGGDGDSIGCLQEVFKDTIGSGAAPVLLTVFMFVFAFTCLMSDIVVAEGNLLMFGDHKAAKLGLKLLVIIVVFVFSWISSDYAFIALDVMMAVCAFFNAYLILKLYRRGAEAFRDYRRQKKEGVEEPVFDLSCLSDQSGITAWKKED